MATEETVEENVGDRQWMLETEDPHGDPLTLLVECEDEDLHSNKIRGTSFTEFLERERTTH